MLSIPESISSGTPVITTSVPYTMHDLEKNKLGIVKDNWGVSELIDIIENNEEYVNNCIDYREKLTSTASAQSLINAHSQKYQ